MTDLAIRISNLSKSYVISRSSQSRATNLSEALIQKLQSPFRRMPTEEFWALKEIDLEIKKGAVVGLIGRNGAGKSTLLKILSRITEPTTGRIELFGRVGSLLEVGTGFHPELTGRENIFLNGTILGMKKSEIHRQFDAIVEFSGVERFLETPVKRYSSGMYVRLAFAVAAHLNPEILIVDEVLAVGDAEFQKKCLGKMQDVANEGRTVFFVSHNMQVISTLTRSVILLKDGRVDGYLNTNEGIDRYNGQNNSSEKGWEYLSLQKKGNRLHSALIETSEPHGRHRCQKPLTIAFRLAIEEPAETLCFSFQLIDESGRPVVHCWLFDGNLEFRRKSGTYTISCTIPNLRLFEGRYSLTTHLSDKRSQQHFETQEGIASFSVVMEGLTRSHYNWRRGDCAYLEDFCWKLEDAPAMENPIEAN